MTCGRCTWENSGVPGQVFALHIVQTATKGQQRGIEPRSEDVAVVSKGIGALKFSNSSSDCLKANFRPGCQSFCSSEDQMSPTQNQENISKLRWVRPCLQSCYCDMRLSFIWHFDIVSWEGDVFNCIKLVLKSGELIWMKSVRPKKELTLMWILDLDPDLFQTMEVTQKNNSYSNSAERMFIRCIIWLSFGSNILEDVPIWSLELSYISFHNHRFHSPVMGSFRQAAEVCILYSHLCLWRV